MKIKKANDNIFAELGFERPEEEAAKVDLAYEIFTILKSRKLTQTKAAALLGISQADVSKLMNVRPYGFSLDRLIAILTRLERDVEIRVTKSPGSRRLGKVKAVLAA
jgi:predicted XRE-type DNA-binding protein